MRAHKTATESVIRLFSFFIFSYNFLLLCAVYNRITNERERGRRGDATDREIFFSFEMEYLKVIYVAHWETLRNISTKALQIECCMFYVTK